MKNKAKTIAKYAGILIIVATVIFCIISIVSAARMGNQIININNSETYYSGNNVTALVQLKDERSNNLKGNITARLLDSNQKKVKNSKQKYKTDENGITDVNLPISNLKSGTYYLEIAASSKKR